MVNDMFRKAAYHKLTHRSALEKMFCKANDKHWRKIGAIHKFPNGQEGLDIVTVVADNMKRNTLMCVAAGAAAIIGTVCGNMTTDR